MKTHTEMTKVLFAICVLNSWTATQYHELQRDGEKKCDDDNRANNNIRIKSNEARRMEQQKQFPKPNR